MKHSIVTTKQTAKDHKLLSRGAPTVTSDDSYRHKYHLSTFQEPALLLMSLYLMAVMLGGGV